VSIVQRREKQLLDIEFGLEKALDILRKFPGKEHKEVASYI